MTAPTNTASASMTIAENQRHCARAPGGTPDTALRLARFFDTTAQFWLNLQTAFDLKQVEKEVGGKIAEEVRPMQRAA